MVQFLQCLVLLTLAAAPALAASAPVGPADGQLAVAKPAGRAITGRVVDRRGAPLAGVFVTMQSAPSSATTNSAGSFLLACELANPVLTFKCAGYQTQTVQLKSAQPMVLTMSEVGTTAAALGTGLEAVNKPVILADDQPAFPGGVEAYRAFLQKNVQYPEAAKARNISGDVFVSFSVDEAGRLLDAEVIKGVGYGLDEEALRLVRLMPWWTPARLAGKPVRVPATLRIRFGMQEQ
jgi:TonB family protein